MTNPLETFFAISAQVIFTIFGFVLVALTIDRTTRDYWLSKRWRRYTIIQLLSVIVPGLLALLGTMSLATLPKPFPQVNAWVYASALIETFYITLLIRAKKEKKNADERINRLNSDLSKSIVFLFLVSLFSSITYLIDSNLWLANILIVLYIVVAIILGIITSIDFLEIPKQGTDVAGANKALISKEETNKQVLNTNHLTLLIVALSAFFLGVFVSKKGK